MASYKTYDVVGAKEDVSDIISRISPEETPFTRLIGKEKVHNTLFQWQEDALAAPNGNNALVEGADFVDTTLTPTLMRQNYTQIMSKVVNVSETNDVVTKYGRGKELAYQLEKKGAEAKIDLEYAMLNNQAAVAGGSATARKFASVQQQIDADNRIATGSATTAPTAKIIKDTMQAQRVNGARCTNLMIPVAESDVPGTWLTANAGQYVRQVPNSGEASHGVVDYVDYFVTPTGRLDIELNLWMQNTDYLIFSPKHFALCTLRPWTTETLAKTADSNRVALVGEFSLKHKNYKASAVIRKVTGTNGKF